MPDCELIELCTHVLSTQCCSAEGPFSISTKFVSPLSQFLTTTIPQMPRVYLIAVGGASCSGKTTLAKHLRSILSPTDSPTSARILHQDDFAPPADLIPLHPIHGVQDWDSVEGAIDWECQRRVLRGLKRTGEFEDGYKSHDALNEQIPVPISVEVERRWRERFETLVKEQEREKEGREKVVFVLADGFLMLCDAPSVELFDVKLFVREDRTTLKRRRDDRNGYVRYRYSSNRDSKPTIDAPFSTDCLCPPLECRHESSIPRVSLRSHSVSIFLLLFVLMLDFFLTISTIRCPSWRTMDCEFTFELLPSR